jgi:hypothetical protein
LLVFCKDAILSNQSITSTELVVAILLLPSPIIPDSSKKTLSASDDLIARNILVDREKILELAPVALATSAAFVQPLSLVYD